MDTTTVAEIKAIVGSHERLREASLEAKFNPQQRDLINTFSGSSFKERMLRACGYGACKTCGAQTRYMEKMRFLAHCSTACEVAPKRSNRHEELRAELARSKHQLTCISEPPPHVDAEFTVECQARHRQTITLRQLRYRLNFECIKCRAEERAAERTVKLLDDKAEGELRQAQNRQAALAKREDSKAQTMAKRRSKVGQPSKVHCKSCGKLTKLALTGRGDKQNLYEPKFCDEACTKAYLETQRKEKIGAKLKGISAVKDWILVQPVITAAIKQPFTFTGCGHTLELNYKNVASFPELYNDPDHKCPRCSAFGSKYQRRVLELYQQHGVKTIKNDRAVLGDRLEIDVYLPEHKLGIELDGVWWHSDRYKSDTYHLLKTESAQLQGVKLIHIFSDEYDERPLVVESRLLTMVGVVERRINARDCEVRELPTVVRKEFIERTHLQGDTGASIGLGLYHGASLVAAMSFRKPRDLRMQAQYEWEMIRYVSELNVVVRGGAGKLLAHFEKLCRPKSLLSYADRRWSQGKLYLALGFNHKRTSEPGYSYVLNGKREGRQKYRKKEVLAAQPNFDPSLSEREIMRMNGMPQIYDCGQLVFEKIYD